MRVASSACCLVIVALAATAAAQPSPPPPVIVPAQPGHPAATAVPAQPAPPPPVVVPGRPVVSAQPGTVVPADTRPRPVIERIEPTSGPGGTVVVIVGRNFGAGDTVTLNGEQLEVREVVPTRITTVIPVGARSGRLVVRGTSVVESSQTFNVIVPPPPPSVTGFSPTAGPPGTDVVVYGSGFSVRIYENAVSLSGLTIPVRTASTTQLTVTIPEGAATGPVVVTVANAGQARAPADFQVQAPLRIDRLEPAVGPVGAQVRIVGSGFIGTLDGNVVKIGDRRCTVRSASPTDIVVEIPARALTGSFLVAVTGRGELLSPQFRVVYPPVLRSFGPAAGFPGTEVVLRGDYLGDSISGTQVTLSGVSVPVTSVTPAEVRVRIPDGASTGVLQLSVAGAGSAATSGPFEVWVPLAIGGFHPPRGIPGTRVTVAGHGFVSGSATTARIGEKRASVVSATDAEIVFDVPGGAVTGRILVSVRGRGEAQSATEFVVLAAPSVSEVTPGSVPPGGEVTLIGANFGSSISDVAVTFGGVACTVRSMSSTQIVVVVPAGVERDRFLVSIRGVGDAQSSVYRVGRAAPPPLAPPPPVVVPGAVPVPPPPPVVPGPPPGAPVPPGPPPPAIIR